MTKVPLIARHFSILLAIAFGLPPFPIQRTQAAAVDAREPGPAESLYLELRSVGLDPKRVFRVRDASIDRSAVHITLEDGTIAFTQDVFGKITGAFFEGDGEVLVVPPNQVERESMSLFTGMAILEERFATAYFRFNDDTAFELKPGLRAAENAAEFVSRWDETAHNLAKADALRLLVSFSKMLPPLDAASPSGPGTALPAPDSDDHLFHARVQGEKLGVFDLFVDSTAGEPVEVGQARAADDGTTYYDVWASFSNEDGAEKAGKPSAPSDTSRLQDPIAVRRYAIEASVKPPKRLDGEAKLELEVLRGGQRALVFELSRFLQVESVEADGQPLEFIHNPAVEGTQLARQGNDLVTVLLPSPARTGQKINLRFVYGGEVIAEAGKGLLYVGARGTWYPNRGLQMAAFNLTFHYPEGWTLVATGKPAPGTTTTPPKAGSAAYTVGEQAGRWVSERPIPVAGFNLGKYVRATAQAGNTTVDTYATTGVERDFPSAPVLHIPIDPAAPGHIPSEMMAAPPPSPARNAMVVAEVTARAIQFYAARFGPFPYSQLAMTQMPGRESQGWPGLVFLSSFAFLTKDERTQLHMNSARTLIDEQIPAHETAHQWWGDLITWKSYRDQWLSEGLANYSALMMLQEKNQVGFRELMEMYQRDLVEKNKDGSVPKDAGPVTLGGRLLSSRFPGGYEAISYGRGTWLFHMLRCMLQDSVSEDSSHPGNPTEEPFVRGLHKLRERYEGKAISTRELLDVFAEELPPSLRYEGKTSLDWFLDGWVNGTSLPRLQLQGVKFVPKGRGFTVTGTIVQKDAPDSLVTSVPIYAVGQNKTQVLLGRVFADGPESSFRLSAPAGSHKLLLDPYGTVLTAPK